MSTSYILPPIIYGNLGFNIPFQVTEKEVLGKIAKPRLHLRWRDFFIPDRA